MYIIVKGRVAFEVKMEKYGHLPVVIALVSDGESFGHVSLNDLEFDATDPKYQRPTSCVAVEDTDLLVLNKKLLQRLENTGQANKVSSGSALTFRAIASHPKLDLVRQKQQELEQRAAFLKTVP